MLVDDEPPDVTPMEVEPLPSEAEAIIDVDAEIALDTLCCPGEAGVSAPDTWPPIAPADDPAWIDVAAAATEDGPATDADVGGAAVTTGPDAASGATARLAPSETLATLARVTVDTALLLAPTAAPTCAAALGTTPMKGSSASHATKPRAQCSLPSETLTNARTTRGSNCFPALRTNSWRAALTVIGRL